MIVPSTSELVKKAFGDLPVNLDKANILDRPLYDRLTFAASAPINENTARFFHTMGTKDLSDTNMPTPDQLPAPDMFSIKSIGLYFPINTTAADLIGIFDQLALVIKVRSTEVFNAPLWTLTPGGGMTGFTTVAATTYVGNGLPTREAMHTMALPIVIPSLTTYEVFLKGTQFAPAAQVKMTCILRGLWLKGA